MSDVQMHDIQMHDMQMKVTILGWWGAFPQPGQATCGVLVETDLGAVLLDCGSGVLSQFFCFSSIPRLEAVALSHLHYDHMGDLGCLQYAVNNARRTGTREEKLRVYAPTTPEPMWSTVLYAHTLTHPLEDGMTFEAAGMTITAKRVNHTVECYAFRLERGGKSFVYYTDTTYLPEGAGFIRGADLLLCEATISEGTQHSTGIGHMTDLEAGRTAREGEARCLCLYHLPSDGDIPQMRERAASQYGRPVLTPDLCRVFEL